MQPSNLALEAKMKKTSMASGTFPLVLRATRREVTQALQNTSMLNIKNLDLLKVSGKPMARKAKVKLPRVKEPRYPRTR